MSDLKRRTLRRGAALTATGLGAAAALPGTASASSEQGQAFPAGRPIIFRNATVVTMDAARRVLHDADVLVRGTKIEAVGSGLEAPQDAAVIQSDGGILMPGMIDTHLHMWQTALRGLGADWTVSDYVEWITKWGRLYRPDDVYAGNYFGMVEAVHSGVTTVMDWSHNAHTPEHADAAVDALSAIPGRARFGYGNLFAVDENWVVNGDVDRLLKSRFGATDQLITPQLALTATPGPGSEQVLRFAADRNLPVSLHVGVFGFTGDPEIEFLSNKKFLSPAYTLVHGGWLSDDSYRRIADSGAYLSISAESELNAGQGYPPTAKARRFGIPVSLSQDTVVWWSGDMFSAMRATLNADRGLAHLRAHENTKMVATNALRAADVVAYATIDGARALGLADKIGSITPGKLADLVLLRSDNPTMFPVNNPFGHIAFQAGRGDVDTVLVNGRVLKHRHVLLGGHVQRARRLAQDSLQYLRSKIGEAEWQQALNPPLNAPKAAPLSADG